MKDAEQQGENIIRSCETWCDKTGNPIQAHGGGILYHEGRYYWYGEDKNGETESGEHIICGFRMNAIGVHCYSSSDLCSWVDEGLVLPALMNEPEHDLYYKNVLERPKVIYNKRSGLFVMWIHVDTADYTKASAGVAISKKPTGPFRYIGSIRPDGNDCRDMTIFQDEDRKSYMVYSSEWNKTLCISELTEDYLGLTGRFTRNFINSCREAPAVFKNQGRYYLISSGCTGWDPNEAQYAVADSMMGNWKVIGNPCKGKDGDKTFYAQSTFVLPIAGYPCKFIMMFDQWKKENLRNSKYLWLPVSIDGDKVEIEWCDSWDLSGFCESQEDYKYIREGKR